MGGGCLSPQAILFVVAVLEFHLSLHTPVSDFRAGDAPPYLHKEQVGFTERLDKV